MFFKTIHNMNWEVLGELVWNDPVVQDSTHLTVTVH